MNVQWLVVNCNLFESQLARHNKILQQSLRPGAGQDPDHEQDDALHYYANHTAQIEVGLMPSSKCAYLDVTETNNQTNKTI